MHAKGNKGRVKGYILHPPTRKMAQWWSVRLPIGRLGVRSTATEGIAVALLGQELSLQSPRQEANFRLRPFANCRHQKRKKQTALIKHNWCVILYCCACLQPNTTLMEAAWTTVPCPATNLRILISLFYFKHKCEFDNVLHEDNNNLCVKFRRNFHRNLHHQRRILLNISEHNNITRTVLHITKGNIPSEQFRKINWSRFSIRSIFRLWKRITTLSFLLEEYPLERDHLNNVLINEELLIFINIFSYFIHSTLLQDTRHLQFNRARRNVEFALHSQHETSCDPEIQTKKDLKREFIKQLGSLLIISTNSKDKEKAFEC